MASSSETGHSKNVTNFETLILSCTGFGADYNPSISDILISNLTTQHTNAKVSVQLVKTTEAPFNEVEGQRKTIHVSKMLDAHALARYHIVGL